MALITNNLLVFAQQTISTQYNIPNTVGGFKVLKTQAGGYLMLLAENENRNEGYRVLKTNCTGEQEEVVNLRDSTSPDATFTDWYYNPETDSLFILGFSNGFNNGFQKMLVIKTNADLAMNVNAVIQLDPIVPYINFVAPNTSNSQLILKDNQYYIFASQQLSNQYNTWDVVMQSFDANFSFISSSIIDIYSYDDILEISPTATGFYLNLYSHTGGTGILKIDLNATVIWNTDDIFDLIGDGAFHITTGQNDTLYIAKISSIGGGDNAIIRVDPSTSVFLDTLTWGYTDKTEIITDLQHLSATNELMLINTIDFVPDGEIFKFAYNPNAQPVGTSITIPNIGGDRYRMHDLLAASSDGTAFAIVGQVTGAPPLPFLYSINNNTPPTPIISGTTTVCNGNSSAYTITSPYSAASNFTWTVTGGTIQSGQGTPTIQVLWNSTNVGMVSVAQSE